MADILRLLIFIILMTVGLVAYFLVANALFPHRVLKTQNIIRSMPVRALGIGLVNFVFFAVIVLALFSLSEDAAVVLKAILTIPALLILALLAILFSFGLTGMSNLIGERVFPESSAWKQTLWGTICLSLACALPFVGWFLLLPYAGFVGIGAVILGLFQREN